MYKRRVFGQILNRLLEPRKFIQIVAGPRQTGKTTLIQQVTEEIRIPFHYAATDAGGAESATWIEQQWDIARLKLKSLPNGSEFILVLDEIQKISDWSEVVKKLWDEDSLERISLKVVLLGSSPLLIQKGLTETLAGRYELIRISHWSRSEMQEAFAFTLDQFVYFGGYPGAASLTSDEDRWKSYVRDSLIEPTLSRDILMMSRVDKPSLLKRLFELGCLYSGQVLSYNKMLGQLQDAGNTVTLAHYLELLSAAGLLLGLEKYAPEKLKQRASSPKFQVLNTALITAQAGENFNKARTDPEYWGRLVESAAGANLVNQSISKNINIYYWRERNKDVDFVLEKDGQLVAIEVKSGRRKESAPGIDMFSRKFQTKRKLLVGKGGLELDEFFSIKPEDLF
jgi:hypothetical protein